MATWNTLFNNLPTGTGTTGLIRDGDNYIRETRVAVEERLTKEHVMNLNSGLSSEDGYHRKGSAVCFFQEAEPFTNPYGDFLSSADNGRLWYKPSTGEVGYYDDTNGGWQIQKGSSSQYVAAETLYAGELAALLTNGQIALADNTDSGYINVVGFVVADVAVGNIGVVLKAGLIGGFTGLETGAACFLSTSGMFVQDDDLIDEYTYRCFVGYAKSDQIVDALIQEPTLNAPQDVLTVKAFKGKKNGLDAYYSTTNTLIVRPGAAHVNDGITDWWVEVGNAYTLDVTAVGVGAWRLIYLDRFGNISMDAADLSTSVATERPNAADVAFYQWGEDGGTGYNHQKMGYYSGTKRVIGAVHKVSTTSFYIINQLDGSDEIGENSLGRWKRTGGCQEIEALNSTLDTTSSGNSNQYYGANLTVTYPVPLVSVDRATPTFSKVSGIVWAAFNGALGTTSVIVRLLSNAVDSTGYVGCSLSGPWQA